MKKLMITSILAVGILLCWNTIGNSEEESDKNPIDKIISGNRSIIDAGKNEILKSSGQLRKSLIEIAGNEDYQKKKRKTVITAIELLGKLRVKSAATLLTEMLLFGYKEDMKDREEHGKTPLPPHKAAPAVQALIEIGVPSLKPVTEKLLSLKDQTQNKYTWELHCHWVIKGALGPKLGKAYLIQLMDENDKAKESKFVKEGLHFMDIFMKKK